MSETCSSAVVQGSHLDAYFLYCSASPVLEHLIIFEQGARHSQLASGLAKHVACAAMGPWPSVVRAGKLQWLTGMVWQGCGGDDGRSSLGLLRART